MKKRNNEHKKMKTNIIKNNLNNMKLEIMLILKFKYIIDNQVLIIFFSGCWEQMKLIISIQN